MLSMQDEKPGVRWIRTYWDEGDVLFYLELDEDGWAVRQVELEGPAGTPVAAASLRELPDVVTDGLEAVQRYEARYGGVASAPWTSDFPEDTISADEFNEVWARARAHLDEP